MKKFLYILMVWAIPSFVIAQAPQPEYFIDYKHKAVLVNIALSDTLDFDVGFTAFSLRLISFNLGSMRTIDIFNHYYEYRAEGLYVAFPINAFLKKQRRAKLPPDQYHYAMLFRKDGDLVASFDGEEVDEMLLKWLGE